MERNMIHSDCKHRTLFRRLTISFNMYIYTRLYKFKQNVLYPYHLFWLNKIYVEYMSSMREYYYINH